MGCSTCKYHTLDRIGEDYMLDDYCTYYNEWGKRDVDHWVRKENGVRECEGYESSSGCFLTSACCAYLGKPDDCVELETLRHFRDQKLKGTPEGDALVKDYYESAPKIVEGIEESGKKEEYYAYIYDVILECIADIEEGKDEEAVKAYLDMYRRLSAKFLPKKARKRVCGYKAKEDIEIDGVILTNIYVKESYYPKTGGTNYEFAFYSEVEDEDRLYDLCKKAFKVGKNHVKYTGSWATTAEDHDFVCKIKGKKTLLDAGCNWSYMVVEGNPD